MCITFSVKHVCGHEHIRHVVRCAHAIKTQLELVDHSEANERRDCLYESDLPREHIKPGLCEQCKENGLAASFFESDPAIEFEILRQWQVYKRISRVRKDDAETIGARCTIKIPENEVCLSDAPSTSDHPGTPGSSTLSS